jgi:hypothetical protein
MLSPVADSIYETIGRLPRPLLNKIINRSPFLNVQGMRISNGDGDGEFYFKIGQSPYLHTQEGRTIYYFV